MSKYKVIRCTTWGLKIKHKHNTCFSCFRSIISPNDLVTFRSVTHGTPKEKKEQELLLSLNSHSLWFIQALCYFVLPCRLLCTSTTTLSFPPSKLPFPLLDWCESCSAHNTQHKTSGPNDILGSPNQKICSIKNPMNFQCSNFMW